VSEATDSVITTRKTGFGQSAESVIAIALLSVCAAAGIAAWFSSVGDQERVQQTSDIKSFSEVTQNNSALRSEEEQTLADWQRRLDGEFSKREQSQRQQLQLATMQEQAAALALAQAAAESAARAAEAAEARAREAEKARQLASLKSVARSKPVKKVVPVQERPVVAKKVETVASSIDWDSCKPPVYPDESVRLGQQGTVTMEFNVDANGEVQDGKIVESSGTRRLDYRALSTLSKCRFEPALTNGKPVASVTQLRFTWKLTR
jgi:TonB family protein